MAVLRRHGVALLAIAACATSAFAAEGQPDASPEVLTEVVNQPQAKEPILNLKNISPPAIAAAFALGLALLAVISLAGIKVKGITHVQSEAKNTHIKVSDAIMALTENLIITTELYVASIRIHYDPEARKAIETIEAREKALKLKEMRDELELAFKELDEGGQAIAEYEFGKGKVRAYIDVRPPAPDIL